ncbi:MAG: hypothetical protein K6T73_07775 [Candidatus Bathyarchaeota archaeon]|nr:hypothetical protein [Candidatus Bathyarchaeota archaeon]
MKKADFQLMGSISVALGVIFLARSIIASLYFEVRRGVLIQYIVYPYAWYSAPLFVSGIISLIFGIALLWRAMQEDV